MESTKDQRRDIVLTIDEWIAINQVSEMLPNIPGICQRDGRLLIEDDGGLIHPISHGKLRHYLGTICRFFDPSGRRVHPTGRLVNGVHDNRVYPGVRIIG